MAEAYTEQIFRAKFQDDLTGPAAAAANRTAALMQGMVSSIQGNIQGFGGEGAAASSGPLPVVIEPIQMQQLAQIMGSL